MASGICWSRRLRFGPTASRPCISSGTIVRTPELDRVPAAGGRRRPFLSGRESPSVQLARRKCALIVAGESFRSQHANTVHFGLRSATNVDAVEIRWANGKTRAAFATSRQSLSRCGVPKRVIPGRRYLDMAAFHFSCFAGLWFLVMFPAMRILSAFSRPARCTWGIISE